MILTCPSCGTQYVVKDGAIPQGGRQVRCASCKHSWHQDPETPVTADTPAQAESAPEFEAPSSRSDEADVPVHEPDEEDVQDPVPERSAHFEEDTSHEGEAESFAVAPAHNHIDDEGADEAAASEHWSHPQEDDFGPFGQRHEAAEDQPKRPLLKVLLVVLAVAALAAAFWFLAPAEWKNRVGLAQAGTSPLQLMLTHSQRQELASGNSLLAVTGRVINPTGEAQNVPPIKAELRKKSGEVVYSWTISPPARSIPPGGRAPFNSGEMNVPAEGDLLTISFGPTRA